jgi:hypothetical protein
MRWVLTDGPSQQRGDQYDGGSNSQPSSLSRGICGSEPVVLQHSVEARASVAGVNLQVGPDPPHPRNKAACRRLGGCPWGWGRCGSVLRIVWNFGFSSLSWQSNAPCTIKCAGSGWVMPKSCGSELGYGCLRLTRSREDVQLCSQVVVTGKQEVHTLSTIFDA